MLCSDLKQVRHQDKLLLSLKMFDFQQAVTKIKLVWDALFFHCSLSSRVSPIQYPIELRCTRQFSVSGNSKQEQKNVPVPL